MPILFTYQCVQCGTESEPSTNQIIPNGWIMIGYSGGVGSPSGPDYCDKWECVRDYATAKLEPQ